MIATCPACAKRYRLADEAVPPEGRSVRCAACGHGWTAHRDDAPPIEPSPPVVASVEPPPHAAGPAGREPSAGDPARFPAGARLALTPFSERIAPDDDTSSLTAASPDAGRAAARPRRARRRWPWIAALLVLLALGALAVVEFAPAATFTPPRLGLPPVALPMADLGSISPPKLNLPKLHIPPLPALDLPPLDLTRIPYVGADLDRLVNPPPVPPSPLKLSVTGERSQLGSGRILLAVAGSVTNPTAAPLAVPAIEARLADPAGKVALRWRIAAPVAVLPPRSTAAFHSTAANYPEGATSLRLRFLSR